MSQVTLEGWGRYPRVAADLRRGEDLGSLAAEATLFRGLGRAYGDAALPARAVDIVGVTDRACRVLDFDRDTGVLRAEAGVSLGQLHDLTLADNWACPVMPGTQFVTVGGMVAADVHGKNHHVDGCIGRHIRELTVRTASGETLLIGPEEHADLFYATQGGMGLTGHILEVELQLSRIPSSWIVQQTETAGNLREVIDLLARASDEWPMTVAWADGLKGGTGLGRGLVISGRWATPEERPQKLWRRGREIVMPPIFPTWTPRRSLVRVFNEVYFRAKAGTAGRSLVGPLPFFHPLDLVRRWNRFYGRNGFTQYQCVLPWDAAEGASEEIFTYLQRSTEGNFLAVVKDFGDEGCGTLSFPRPGLTLSLDIPIVPGVTEATVRHLNGITTAAGGRIYLAKDALTTASDFARMETRLDAFNEVRDRWDPQRRLRSALSVRLLGDRP